MPRRHHSVSSSSPALACAAAARRRLRLWLIPPLFNRFDIADCALCLTMRRVGTTSKSAGLERMVGSSSSAPDIANAAAVSWSDLLCLPRLVTAAVSVVEI